MHSVYLKKEDCCGCGACFHSCPKQAIAMEPDEEGFLYPVIDPSRCVDCGKCAAVCPILSEGNLKQTEIPRLYAARHQSQDVLRRSTSGGAFTAVSDAVLQLGGVVYGADFDRGFRVVHQRAETPAERDRMRISKYVQSDLGNTFPQIKSDLENGRTVLFTGTPCQNAGLRSFIGASSLSEKLYLCDVICYSIPSPLIWEDYKRFLEKIGGGKLTALQFRSKKYSWTRKNSKKGFWFTTEGNPEPQEDDRFYKLFFQAGTINRLSCSQCRFTDFHRASDLTIADYWGIEKYSPEWYDPLGVSLILVNSPKGERLFEAARKGMTTEERPLQEALQEQRKLSEPTPVSKDRTRFWTEYGRFGFEYVLHQYAET